MSNNNDFIILEDDDQIETPSQSRLSFMESEIDDDPHIIRRANNNTTNRPIRQIRPMIRRPTLTSKERMNSRNAFNNLLAEEREIDRGRGGLDTRIPFLDEPLPQGYKRVYIYTNSLEEKNAIIKKIKPISEMPPEGMKEEERIYSPAGPLLRTRSARLIFWIPTNVILPTKVIGFSRETEIPIFDRIRYGGKKYTNSKKS